MPVESEAQQGTEAWFDDRAGAVTASKFSTARSKVGQLDERQSRYVELIRDGSNKKQAAEAAGYKSPPSSDRIEKAIAGEDPAEWSEGAKKYAFRLAVERITGRPMDEGFETWAMRRGRELEPDARTAHEWMLGVDIEPAGYIRTDDGRFGASADGLIGDNGAAEYKCLVSPDSIMPVMLEFDIRDYMDQMQGGMMVTGRSWWQYGLYIPDLAEIGKDLTLHHVPRDEEYIRQLRSDLEEFDGLVEEYRQKIIDAPIMVGFDRQ